MEELCVDGSRRRVVAWAKCIQDDLKIQLGVYRTNCNQTYRYSNYTASLHSLWVTYHCFPGTISLLVLVPASSEIWICRQSTIFSIVDLIRIIWLCPGTEIFEIAIHRFDALSEELYYILVVLCLAPF